MHATHAMHAIHYITFHSIPLHYITYTHIHNIHNIHNIHLHHIHDLHYIHYIHYMHYINYKHYIIYMHTYITYITYITLHTLHTHIRAYIHTDRQTNRHTYSLSLICPASSFWLLCPFHFLHHCPRPAARAAALATALAAPAARVAARCRKAERSGAPAWGSRSKSFNPACKESRASNIYMCITCILHLRGGTRKVGDQEGEAKPLCVKVGCV